MKKQKTSLAKEFRDFITRGNVIDLAIGVLAGSSLTAVVNSLINGIIMPPIGFLVGKVNFNELKIVLQQATTDNAGKPVAEIAILYGAFIQSLINFLVISTVIFSLVKIVSAFRKEDETKAEPLPTPSKK